MGYYRSARRLAHSAGRAVETEERRRVAEKQIRGGPAAVLQDHRVGLYPGQFYRNVSMLAQECAHARARVRDSASVSDCGDIAGISLHPSFDVTDHATRRFSHASRDFNITRTYFDTNTRPIWTTNVTFDRDGYSSTEET